MSRTLFIEHGGHGFWAFDVVSSVLLKHLVDAASSRLSNSPWLAGAVEHWRFNAICSDCGFFIDESWSDEQARVFCELLDSACRILQRRDGIGAEEIENWQILDDHRICARGIPVVPTSPVIQLGRAIIALVEGTLPKAPVGHWWFYGIEDSPQTLRKRSYFTIPILEDSLDRRRAMKAAVDEALPDAVCWFFNSAYDMINWLSDWLASPHERRPALISLDHDLEAVPEPDGHQVDPGDGRDVAEYLAVEKPFCPIIIHTSNAPGASSMTSMLEEAGWQVTRVYPENDVEWVRPHWIACVSRLAYEWEELHGTSQGAEGS